MITLVPAALHLAPLALMHQLVKLVSMDTICRFLLILVRNAKHLALNAMLKETLIAQSV